MIQTVKARAIVKPGGFIEVHSDELPEGATVEVIVLVEEPEEPEKPLKELIDFIGAANPNDSEDDEPKGLSRFIGVMKGKGSFNSTADIDEYIRQERDSWDS